MYKSSDFKKEAYKTNEIMRILNVSYGTINNYDKQQVIKFTRGPKGRRLVYRDDLLNYLDSKGLLYRDDRENKRDVIYARVSSADQKEHGDLDRQALFLIENVNGLNNPLVLKEVGSGLNDKRPKLQKLIQMVLNDEVSNVYVTYKDRLTRFGFQYLETVFSAKGVSIIVVKDKKETKSVEEELVEDMMNLIASFSGKLYGMRSRKNKEVEK